jgi:hypothetical protein
LAYGPTEIEKLDLYATKTPNAAINVFIHGGAWRAGSAAASAFQSEMFVDAGAHFIALDFNNVIETKGDLTVMADQVRRGVAWVYRNARSFGGDHERLFVSGHSSGAHLAAVVLTSDWRTDFGLPMDTVKGALCASRQERGSHRPGRLQPLRGSGEPRQPVWRARSGRVAADETVFLTDTTPNVGWEGRWAQTLLQIS